MLPLERTKAWVAWVCIPQVCGIEVSLWSHVGLCTQ